MNIDMEEVKSYLNEGYRPRLKKVKGITYMSLRKGNLEKGLGFVMKIYGLGQRQQKESIQDY